MGVEPRIGQLPRSGQQYLAAGFRHGLFDAFVDLRGVIRLGLGNVGGDIRALIAALLFGNELQHKGAGQDGLGLQGFQGPIVAHFPGQYAADIALNIHGANGFSSCR